MVKRCNVCISVRPTAPHNCRTTGRAVRWASLTTIRAARMCVVVMMPGRFGHRTGRIDLGAPVRGSGARSGRRRWIGRTAGASHRWTAADTAPGASPAAPRIAGPTSASPRNSDHRTSWPSTRVMDALIVSSRPTLAKVIRQLSRRVGPGAPPGLAAAAVRRRSSALVTSAAVPMRQE